MTRVEEKQLDALFAQHRVDRVLALEAGSAANIRRAAQDDHLAHFAQQLDACQLELEQLRYRSYTVERFLMGLDAMTAARAARAKLTPPVCGADEAAARALGAAQSAIRAALPAEPNERLRYNCKPAP